MLIDKMFDIHRNLYFHDCVMSPYLFLQNVSLFFTPIHIFFLNDLLYFVDSRFSL